MNSQENSKYDVFISGRKYPLVLSPAELRIMPDVEQLIHEQMQSLQRQFKDLDTQDKLAMTVLTLAKSVVELRSEKDQSNRQLDDLLANIDARLV